MKLLERLRYQMLEPSPFVTEAMAVKARSFGIAKAYRIARLSDQLNVVGLKIPTLEEQGSHMLVVLKKEFPVSAATKFQIFQIPVNDHVDQNQLTTQSQFGGRFRNHHYYAWHLNETNGIIAAGNVTADLLNRMVGVHLSKK